MSVTRPPVEESSTEGVTRDDVFEVLSNRRRRYALRYLDDQGGEAELSEVAEHVAAWEHGVDPDRLEYGDRKSVRVSIHQHHAPKMDDVGVLEYDKRRGVLRLTEAASDLAPVLDADASEAEPETPDWETRLAVVAVASTAVVLGGLFDVPPFLLPDVVWTLLAAAAFGGYSLWILADVRRRVVGEDGGLRFGTD